MLIERRETGQYGRTKKSVKGAEQGETVTNDFVHFVMHFTAQASGSRCDMCADERPLRYS